MMALFLLSAMGRIDKITFPERFHQVSIKLPNTVQRTADFHVPDRYGSERSRTAVWRKGGMMQNRHTSTVKPTLNIIFSVNTENLFHPPFVIFSDTSVPPI
jgi:hypothetical protein